MSGWMAIAVLLLAQPELPEVCHPPATRDVDGLASLAQASGALSVGLDSVATWCFDEGGTWTGGHTGKRGEAKKPTGDCEKAIASCQAARASVTPELAALLAGTLDDLKRPYLGARYVPRRSGLAERPDEKVDCRATSAPALHRMAQARMDVARLASQAQNEYQNYRTWLFSQGLACAEAVARGQKDPTRRGMARDTVSIIDGGRLDVPPGAMAEVRVEGGATGSAAGVLVERSGSGGPSGAVVERSAGTPPSGVVMGRDALTPAAGVVVERSGQAPGSGVVVERSGQAPDTGVVVERSGQAPGSGVVVEREAQGLGSATGRSGQREGAVVVERAPGVVPVGGPTASRQKALASTAVEKWQYLAAEHTRLEADPDWRAGFLASRELRECRCARVTPRDIVRRYQERDRLAQLEADDEKNTRCEVCLLDAYPPWRSRVNRQCALMAELSDYELTALEKSDDGNGLPPRCFTSARAARGQPARPSTPPGSAARASPPATATAPAAGGSSGFIITRTPDTPPPAPAAATGPSGGGEVVRAPDYAPVPPREEGRVYVRLFMSAACVAELEPGPISARTNDLLPVPVGVTAMTVRSPCGGVAEVYLGKEETPRVSEPFGKNQPLRLQFAK